MTVMPGWLARQLPVVMQQDDFTVRFLAIFEEVADTLVQAVDTIHVAADPSVAPDRLVPWLSGWISAPADPDHDLHPLRQRDWLRTQSQALAARGTRFGLELMLRSLSGGLPVEIIDGGGIYREGTCPEGENGWVQVRMHLSGRADQEQVRQLILEEVPIGVHVDLIVLNAPVPQPRQPLDDAPTPLPAVSGGPYFWDGGREDVYPPLAEEYVPPEPALVPISPAVRRLPGTAGRAVPTGRICPSCAEPNNRTEPNCLRCDAVLRIPPPVVEPEPEPVIEPLWEDDTDWLPERRIWPIVVLVISLFLLLTGIGIGLALLS
jgi:phage tail-like protein